MEMDYFFRKFFSDNYSMDVACAHETRFSHVCICYFNLLISTHVLECKYKDNSLLALVLLVDLIILVSYDFISAVYKIYQESTWITFLDIDF